MGSASLFIHLHFTCLCICTCFVALPSFICAFPIGNTIFGALSRERPVDWGIVVKDLVQRLVSGMGKSKATPICLYVFHLYHSHELLLPTEKEYRIKEALLKHNVESKGEEDQESPANPDEEDSSDDSECESLSSGEIWEIQK